jgi:hypothetical protein
MLAFPVITDHNKGIGVHKDFVSGPEDTPMNESDIVGSHGIGTASAAQWGLASLLIGCSLLIASCCTLAFNVLLFRGGPAGIDVSLAYAGGLIGVVAVAVLGVASLVFGIVGCQKAYAYRTCPALGLAGLIASAVGLVTWLVAAIDLVMILHMFAR